jgi:hypothetical protein
MAIAATTYDNDYPISPEHRKVLTAGSKLDEEFDRSATEAYKTSSKLIKGKFCHSDHRVLVRIEGEIRAPLNHVVGYLNRVNQQYWDVLNADDDSITKDAIIDVTPRSQVMRSMLLFPYPWFDRDAVVNIAWEKIAEGTFHYAAVSITHPEFPESPDYVRATFARSASIVAISPTLTRLVITSKAKLGGNVPRRINDAITVPAATRTPINAMQYFSDVRSPEAYTADDSRELGKLVIYRLHKVRNNREELRKAISKMITHNDAMRRFQAKYNFLDEILFYVVRNKIGEMGPEDKADSIGKSSSVVGKILRMKSSNVTSGALELTRSNAAGIGRGFTLVLLANTLSDAAVDEWVNKFPALLEVSEEFPWFKQMMEGIAAELLAQTPFGLKFRAYSRAAISMLDMVSDVYVANEMMNDDQKKLATILLAMICANVLLQLMAVWLQNMSVKRTNNNMFLLRECLYVVTFVKPGVEANRVSLGQEKAPGAAFTMMEEMAYGRTIELFTEAVPGIVLQSISLIKSKKKSKAAVISLLISAASAALTSASITYDIDTSPVERKCDPDLFGVVPDTGRGEAFTVMFSLSALQVIAKGNSVALLGVTSMPWLMYYLGVDMLLWLLYKVVTRDLIYFAPLPSIAAVPFSIIVRIMAKVMADFTGLQVLHIATQLGGAYFSFNMVMNFASVPVISYLYLEYAEVETGGAEKLNATVLWSFSIGVVIVWAVLFGYFLTCIVAPKFRKSFWSSQTGWRRSESIFVDNADNERRIRIFSENVLLWSGVKEDVKAWTMANWESWEMDKPAWFTPNLIAGIPDEFIPLRFLAILGRARARRGSAAGSVRESMRRDNAD